VARPPRRSPQVAPTRDRQQDDAAHRHHLAADGTVGPIVLSLDAPASPRPAPSGAEAPVARRHSRVRTEWTARLATPADAELLHLPVGTVVLAIRRTVIDADGAVLKTTTTLCPATRTVLHHSYPVAPSR
jgi:UTRA domain